MPQLSRRDVTAALEKKAKATTDSRHHEYYTVELDGRILARTRVSHGRGGDISSGVVSAMARQLALSTSEFTDLVSCSLSGPDFLALLHDRRS